MAALDAARLISESDTVRYTVAEALAAEETGAALAELHELGAFADGSRTRMLHGAVPTINAVTSRVRPATVAAPKPRRSRRAKRAPARQSWRHVAGHACSTPLSTSPPFAQATAGSINVWQGPTSGCRWSWSLSCAPAPGRARSPTRCCVWSRQA